MAQIPHGFVSLKDICPSLDIHMSYGTSDNFTGEIVDGYKTRKAYLAQVAAKALVLVQEDASREGLGLKIYDSYRPVKAVRFFQEWANKDETNPEIQKKFYPGFSRKELFQQGYIAKQSSHSRGCAVDLTLIELKSGDVLDMGSDFDYFNDLSHTESSRVSSDQLKNRLKLKELMEKHGFRNFYQEWWHYSFRPEPFPDEYFDFDVE